MKNILRLLISMCFLLLFLYLEKYFAVLSPFVRWIIFWPLFLIQKILFAAHFPSDQVTLLSILFGIPVVLLSWFFTFRFLTFLWENGQSATTEQEERSD